MTDKELLELAAKAVGIDGEIKSYADGELWLFHTAQHSPWNPLVNDGDALRLAVKLGMGISIPLANKRTDVVTFSHALINAVVAHEGDPYAATRRAITRAAAELGKMKGEK